MIFPPLPHFVFAQSMYSVQSIPLTSTCFRGGAIDYRMSFLCLLARALGVRSPSPSLFFFSQACHPFSFRLPRCVEPPLNKTYFFWWLLFCSYAPYDFSFTCMSFSISFNDCTSGTPEIPFAPKQTEIPPSMLIFPKTQSHPKMVSKKTVFKD